LIVCSGCIGFAWWVGIRSERPSCLHRNMIKLPVTRR
jgi:hypothetical protein